MTDSMGDRLRKARVEAGFRSAADLCRVTGWTYPTYRSHENGARGIPLDAARTYAQRLGVSLLWLLTGAGGMDSATVDDEGRAAIGVGCVAIPLLSWERVTKISDATHLRLEAITSVQNVAVPMTEVVNAIAIEVPDRAMEYAGRDSLAEGDHVILERALGGRNAKPGQIVLAVLPGQGPYLRRLKVRAVHADHTWDVRLASENDAYPSFDLIRFDPENIVGAVVGVHRHFA
jgi:SOS-response transcriptional repressor LexA